MPRKSLRNKQKEIAVQNQIEQEKAKERQKKRKEKEFIASQLARGLHVRNMVWKEEGEEEVIELVVVYKVKEGYDDPFDKDHVMYKQNKTGQVIKKEKVKRVDVRTVERFSKMNLKEKK